MKGNFSRQTFDHKKHYRGVLMQQGRVQLDADWNEQQDIVRHRLETSARDAIGGSGVPDSGAGFDISFTPDHRDLRISFGRIYVDGILCELDETTPVVARLVDVKAGQIQVDYWHVDGRDFQVGQWIEMRDDTGQAHNIFQIIEIDENKQLLTLLIDEDKFKIAPFQQAKALEIRRIITYTTQPDYPNPEYTAYVASVPELHLPEDKYVFLAYIDVWQRHVTALDDSLIREVALGGPDTTTRVQTIWQVKLLPLTLPDYLQDLIDKYATQSASATSGNAGKTNGQSSATQSAAELDQMDLDIIQGLRTIAGDNANSDWNELTTASGMGALNASTYFPNSSDDSGYRGLENQLYRVEIHEGHDIKGITQPTFKWAYNNASLLSLVEVKGNIVTVPSAGEGGILRFSKGQLVEIVDNVTELHPQSVSRGLVEITQVDMINNQLTLDATLEEGKNFQLRAWDGKGEIDPEKGWMPLDGGIAIEFSQGRYRTGDYWLIAARTSTHEIEWPPYQIPNISPLPQLPHGTQHHYYRLSRIRRYKSRNYGTYSVRDYRRFFPPIPHSANALHVAAINWQNDGYKKRSFLKRDGLEIILDAVPDRRSISSATLLVTLEAALPGGGNGVFVMKGSINVQNNIISWHWRGEEKEGFIARVFEKLDELGHELLDTEEHYLRVRVTLKGYAIWRDVDSRRIYLDGQAFAMPGLQTSEQRALMELQFPSGAGQRASDFESWFYMRE